MLECEFMALEDIYVKSNYLSGCYRNKKATLFKERIYILAAIRVFWNKVSFYLISYVFTDIIFHLIVFIMMKDQ